MNNKQLADKLTTELTGILQYVVTDDIQLFSKGMRLGDKTYIPVVISTTTSFNNENRYIKNEVHELQFRVMNEQRDDFYSDMADFRASQQTEIIDSYIVTKVVEKERQTEKNVIGGVDYFDYVVEMRWTYTLGRVGTAIDIEIDGTKIPFTACQVIHDITYVSNQSASNGYRLNNDTIILTVPLVVANAKILELYNEVNSDSYNKIYDVTIDNTERTVALKRGEYTYNNTSQLTTMILTFETHYPRVQVTLDGDTIPVTAYRYSGKVVYGKGVRDGDVERGTAIGKVRTWSITFVINTTTALQKLYANAYDGNVDTTYTLDVGLASTYTVALGDVIEQYTETGDMTLECQFVEVA